MGFWGSLFGGSNPTLNAGINKAGGVSDFSTSKGEGLTSSAGDFFSSIMGGDPAKISKVLAPQIQALQGQGQQRKQTMAQFGNRSGGTNSAAQTIDDTTRGNVDNMISSLTGSAAGASASMGQSLIDTGMKALGQQFEMSQQQMENWSNSILGKGLTTAASAAETYALHGA